MSFRQHIKTILQVITVLAVLVPVISGCNATKYLRDNEYLYKESKVNFRTTLPADVDSAALTDDLIDLSKLEANEKTLGVFPLKTWLYVLGDTAIDHYIKYQEVYDTRFLFLFDYDTRLQNIKPLASDTSRFRQWLMYKAGEKPQLIDDTKMEETEVRMSNFLYNRGYFYNSVTSTVRYDSIKQNGT
ncbi:MAG: hypothetical protein IPL12_13195 [Bacteroidetes bacterium]|nr:hypothetical protein [Bacteroidota bacterium]